MIEDAPARPVLIAVGTNVGAVVARAWLSRADLGHLGNAI
jgi:hypothetical protein